MMSRRKYIQEIYLEEINFFPGDMDFIIKTIHIDQSNLFSIIDEMTLSFYGKHPTPILAVQMVSGNIDGYSCNM